MDVQTANFSGPLDLLLSMLKERKLDVTAVALSEVTEAYLQSVEAMEETEATEVADFLVVASKLVLFKSRTLLPNFFPEEEDEQNLADQLRLYQMFVEASKKLTKRWGEQSPMAFRSHPVSVATEFSPPENATQASMHIAMIKLVERLTPPKALPKVHIDKTVSLKEKIHTLRQKLTEVKQLFFHETLSTQKNTSEVVVGFLAMLELVKQRTVNVQQEHTFGDIMIEHIPA